MSDYNDGLVRLAGDAGALLKKRGETIAVAESSSGGLVSASLLSVPGASSYFLGGGTIYTRVARDALLGLPEEVVTMRASTEDYALIVAEAVRKKLGASWVCARVERAGLPEILTGCGRSRRGCALRPEDNLAHHGNWHCRPGGQYVAFRWRGFESLAGGLVGALTLEPTLQRTRCF